MSDVAKGIARIASPRTLGMMANRRFCVNWRGSLKNPDPRTSQTELSTTTFPLLLFLSFFVLFKVDILSVMYSERDNYRGIGPTLGRYWRVAWRWANSVDRNRQEGREVARIRFAQCLCWRFEMSLWWGNYETLEGEL